MPETDPGEVTHDLIAQARAGSTGAFESLYRIHVGRVYGVCLRILGDPSLAEDATQQVFIRSWTNLASFRGESSFGAWIHRMAVNAAIDELRASEAAKRRHAFLYEVQTASADRAGNLCDAQLDLEKAIAELPARMRVVFVLHEIEGFSHEDISNKLGMSEEVSRGQLFQARKLLREALEKH